MLNETDLGNAKRGPALCLTLVLALLSYPPPTMAEGLTYGQFGIGFDHPGMKKYSDVKYVEFGHMNSRGKCAYKIGGGAWIDNTGYAKKDDLFISAARESFYVNVLFGVEPKTDHFYLSYKVGPAVITHPDVLLGSMVQVSHELSFGMRDMQEVRMGMVIKHFSNGGVLSKYNEGRNFVGLEMAF